jgi:hypothetical protein
MSWVFVRKACPWRGSAQVCPRLRNCSNRILCPLPETGTWPGYLMLRSRSAYSEPGKKPLVHAVIPLNTYFPISPPVLGTLSGKWLGSLILSNRAILIQFIPNRLPDQRSELQYPKSSLWRSLKTAGMEGALSRLLVVPILCQNLWPKPVRQRAAIVG